MAENCFSKEPLLHTFYSGKQPTLLYITKQQFGGEKHDRPLHSHDNLCELLLVFHGYGSYIVGKHSFPIQEGDVLFYNQDDAHEVCSQSGAEIGTFCFGFCDLNLIGLPENHILPEDSRPVRNSGAQFRLLHLMCEQAYQSMDLNPQGNTVAQCLATSFLLMARELPEDPITLSCSEDDLRLADRVREYLDDHFTEPIVLSEIAARFHCSESHVSHIFKRCMGYSPIHYVIRRRIGLAQTFLITTDYTATHIATLVGYDNTNYFNTIFTKIVGLSPLRYKKQYLDAMRGKAAP